VTVAFSPHGQGEALIVSAIGSAKTQILVQAYGFSNKAILAALADAKKRGVDVKVILDKSNDRGKYSGATYVSNAKVPIHRVNFTALKSGHGVWTEFGYFKRISPIY
jgi:phosphatidylserine/phosphatidylglycerophosphate/cardiolipin synthase-like enzyme